MWTPPARHVKRNGKRLACEKHMDWWTASTKPILQPYAIENCQTIALTKERLQMSLAARFLTRDIAQMVDRSLGMREVRGSMPPASPIFQRSPEIKQGKTVSCFVRPKEDMDLYVQYAKGSIWNSTELAEKALIAPGITKVYLRKTSEETLLYWWVNQRPPSDINSSLGPHQRGKSIGKASDWHVSIWNRIELAEKAISAPNRLG